VPSHTPTRLQQHVGSTLRTPTQVDQRSLKALIQAAVDAKGNIQYLEGKELVNLAQMLNSLTGEVNGALGQLVGTPKAGPGSK
jgi:hypothetical protein